MLNKDETTFVNYSGSGTPVRSVHDPLDKTKEILYNINRAYLYLEWHKDTL